MNVHNTTVIQLFLLIFYWVNSSSYLINKLIDLLLLSSFSAACYGNGTYFAVNASYSASNTYSRPNQNGEKCMYLCRVLAGDFALGQQGMKVPPPKPSSPIDKYDSVVDNMSGPSMFIVFHDTQACPEYLITFK